MGTLFVVVNILSLLLFVNSKFEPYADNSGTVVALALHDCCIVASDTRLSDSYMIRSRNQAKILDVSTFSYVYISVFEYILKAISIRSEMEFYFLALVVGLIFMS